MKALIISDSFKGTLTQEEICTIFDSSFKKHFKDDISIKREVADGGEGTINAISKNIDGKFFKLKSVDPYFNEIDSTYFISNNVAYIEVSNTIGLPLIKDNLNPAITSSYGVGIQIKDAIDKGCKKIVIGCGGSSTNDAGLGSLVAIGFKFFDKDNKEFIPTGLTLKNIFRIDDSIKDKYKDIEFVMMSDCINPMHGELGASYIFAKQKGADDIMIKELDDNLKYLDNFFISKYNKNISSVKGTGAAGAFPSSYLVLLNTRIESGINVMLDSMDFDNLIKDVDYIFTGEGKLDEQSLMGKVISGILARTTKQNKKVIIICGVVDKELKDENLNSYNIYKIYETSHGESREYIHSHAKEMYMNAVDLCLEDLKND